MQASGASWNTYTFFDFSILTEKSSLHFSVCAKVIASESYLSTSWKNFMQHKGRWINLSEIAIFLVISLSLSRQLILHLLRYGRRQSLLLRPCRCVRVFARTANDISQRELGDVTLIILTCDYNEACLSRVIFTASDATGQARARLAGAREFFQRVRAEVTRDTIFIKLSATRARKWWDTRCGPVCFDYFIDLFVFFAARNDCEAFRLFPSRARTFWLFARRFCRPSKLIRRRRRELGTLFIRRKIDGEIIEDAMVAQLLFIARERYGDCSENRAQ